jgi:phage recombination protein Bet
MGLNPFVRDAYLIKYGKDADATMVVGKDAFTKRAEGHPQFSGMSAGVIVRQGDAEPIERKGSLSLDGEKIVGGWAHVHRNDHKIPTEITVKMEEFSTGRGPWQKMPGTMIRKVALVTALREAFPSTFSGMYDSAEMKIDLNEQMEPIEAAGGTVPLPAPKIVEPSVPEVKSFTPVSDFKDDGEPIIELEDATILVVESDDEDDIPESTVSGEDLVLESPSMPTTPPDCIKEGHGDGKYEVMESPATGQRRWAHRFEYETNGENKLGWCVYEGPIPVPSEA